MNVYTSTAVPEDVENDDALRYVRQSAAKVLMNFKQPTWAPFFTEEVLDEETLDSLRFQYEQR